MMSALYYTNTFNWSCVLLDRSSNNPRVDMSLHTLSWFRTKQYLHLILKAVYLTKGQQKY
jgi:hypothetical protein